MRAECLKMAPQFRITVVKDEISAPPTAT